MTTQIAIRLPDELVEMVDDMIKQGRGTSRADIVKQALMRVERQLLGEHDAAIYAEFGEDPDLNEFIKYTSHLPMPELD